MYEIYSIGDPEFLYNILNAVVGIVGHGDFTDLIRIGFLLAALFAAFMAVASARGMDFAQLFVSWIIFAVAFGPTTTVTINGVYDSSVRQVANVPLGIATVGSLTSHIGFRLTELMEQAFATPAMTEHGYGDSLETLKRVRLSTLSIYDLGPADSAGGPGREFTRSWSNYIKECRLIIIDAQPQQLHDVFNASPFMDQLEITSRIPYTEINLTGRRTTMPCTQAYAELTAYTEQVFLPAFAGGPLANALNVASGAEALAEIDEAISGLGITDPGMSGGVPRAEDFVITAVLVPLYFEGARSRYVQDMNFAYATMIDDAVRARNSQWTANEDVFTRYVRPMTTFVEGLIYAVSPLLAFFLTLGKFGTKLVLQFLRFLAWIQLWMPLLAIVHLYQHMVLMGEFAELSATGLSILSMNGLFSADDLTQTYLAVGGLMASTVPALALMLIWGSPYIASQIAGRMSSTDTVTEEVAAPRTRNAFPAMEVTAPSSFDPIRRARTTGAEQALVSFSASHEGTRAASSERSEVSRVEESFRQTLGQEIARSSGLESRAGSRGAFSETATAATSEVLRVAESRMGGWAASVADQYGISTQEATRIGAELGLRGRGSSVAGSLDHRENLTDSQAQRIANDWQERFGSDESLTSDMTRAAASEIAHHREDGFISSEIARSSSSLQREASQALTAYSSYSESMRLADNRGGGFRWDGPTAAQRVMANDGARNLLDHYTMGYGLVGAVDRWMDVNPGVVGMFGSEDAARTYAQMLTLDNKNVENQVAGMERDNRAHALDQVLSIASGAAIGSVGGATTFAGIGGGVGGGQAPAFARAFQDLAGGSITDRVTAGFAATDSIVNTGRDEIGIRGHAGVAQTSEAGAGIEAPYRERFGDALGSMAAADANVSPAIAGPRTAGEWAARELAHTDRDTIRAGVPDAAGARTVREGEFALDHGLTPAQASYAAMLYGGVEGDVTFDDRRRQVVSEGGEAIAAEIDRVPDLDEAGRRAAYGRIAAWNRVQGIEQ